MTAQVKTFFEAVKLGIPEAVDLVESMTDTGYRLLPFSVEPNIERGELEAPLDQYLLFCEKQGRDPGFSIDDMDPSDYKDYVVTIPMEEAHDYMTTIVAEPEVDLRSLMRKYLSEDVGLPKRQAALWANQAMALSRHI